MAEKRGGAMSFRRGLCLLAVLMAVGIQPTSGEGPVTGALEIRYRLVAASGDLQPSYQTAIWLEDVEGKLVRSLLVSEWLAYSGHNSGSVCPTWLAVADWQNVSEEELDAVSQATPEIGDSVLRVDLTPYRLAPGRYRYGVETHVVEGYNIVFRGEIDLGSAPSSSQAEGRFVPEAYPGAEGMLLGVEARFVSN
jgi:hypothetical protein